MGDLHVHIHCDGCPAARAAWPLAGSTGQLLRASATPPPACAVPQHPSSPELAPSVEHVGTRRALRRALKASTPSRAVGAPPGQQSDNVTEAGLPGG